MSRKYFTADGSYGDATDMLVIDTDLFTQEDWDEIDNASDSERSDLAQQIALSKKKEAENASNAYRN